MAVLPLRNRNRTNDARIDLARLPVLAAAFLIALFGLLAGTPRSNGDLTASARPLDDRSDRSPALTKRDPVRAVTIAERKDGSGGQTASDDGLPPPDFFVLSVPPFSAALAAELSVAPSRRIGWPGTLPRAPPTSV